jgi:hypothetical protein
MDTVTRVTMLVNLEAIRSCVVLATRACRIGGFTWTLLPIAGV